MVSVILGHMSIILLISWNNSHICSPLYRELVSMNRILLTCFSYLFLDFNEVLCVSVCR